MDKYTIAVGIAIAVINGMVIFFLQRNVKARDDHKKEMENRIQEMEKKTVCKEDCRQCQAGTRKEIDEMRAREEKNNEIVTEIRLTLVGLDKKVDLLLDQNKGK